MASRIVFCIILVAATCSAYHQQGSCSPNAKLKIPVQFHAVGEKIDLIRSIVEKFEVWYSRENGTVNIRTDYYDHKHRVYYTLEKAKDYYVNKVFPKTTEEKINEEVCLKYYVKRSSTSLSFPEIMIIDKYLSKYSSGVQEYSCKNQINMNGKIVDIWEKKDKFYIKREMQNTWLFGTSTMYVYNDEQSGFTLPLKCIWESTTEEAGLTSRIIVNYKQFATNITPADLEYSGSASCLNMTDVMEKDHIENAFESYKKQHGREYISDEHEMRKQIFFNNWRLVTEHNSKNTSYKMALNEFSDRTPDELRYLTGALPMDPSGQGNIEFPHSEEELEALGEHLPEEFDWRLRGVLGPVRHQGSTCGSCYAFAAVGALEAMLAIKTEGDVMDLSEQSIIDCSYGYLNFGCLEGYIPLTYLYIKEHGVNLENEYEYMAREGPCRRSVLNRTISIKNYVMVTPRHPTALKVALVNYGPVAVTIKTSDAIIHYSNGIFNDINPDKTLAHAVVIVGYGTRDGVPYWIVRNSWGENYGMDGYILMAEQDNNCSILNTPFYPIL